MHRRVNMTGQSLGYHGKTGHDGQSLGYHGKTGHDGQGLRWFAEAGFRKEALQNEAKRQMVIGVIGGVGAGKSTVLGTLEKDYGFVILKTDDIAKSFYVDGNSVFEKLKELLGEDIQKEDGTADLKAIAKKLYGSGKDHIRKKVDGIVHPAVWEYVQKEIGSRDADFAVETALPNEAFTNLCDEIWAVYAERSVRVKRLMETRGYTEEKARDMILSQIGDDEYGKIATFRIDNTGSPEETVKMIGNHMRDFFGEHNPAVQML